MGLGIAIGGLAVVACDSSTDAPTAPTTNAQTISVRGELGDQSFSPNPASPGSQAVVWQNDHSVTHRIVANDGSFDLGDLAPGATSMTMQAPAEGLNYHCSIHPTTMFGSIAAAGGGGPPPCTDYCADALTGT